MSKHKTYHFVDVDGDYLGGFGDGATPPIGSIKVNKAPKHGGDIWNGNKWIDYAHPPKPTPPIKAAIQALIDGDTVAAQVAMDKLGD